LDGVRAYWDGHQLFFRSGRLISVPTWFTKSFPAHPWDGELWMGRGSFEQLSAIVRRQNPSDSEWQKVKYNLFELPEGAGDFHQRIERLRAEIAELNVPWVTLIPQQSLDSVDHLILQLKNAVAEKAEGLVLHKMDAQFESGRSDKVFKLKPQFDAEAKVLAIEMGTGKLQGMMGALLIETMDGKRFWLGTGFKLEHRKNPPQLDSWITYRYRDINSNGLPKFASFLRVYHTE
jgi:DNA ligase-1